jgi:FKBP-type peptidyl-prolyl cis-trans isomerase
LLNFDTYFEALYKSSNQKPLKYELDSANEVFLNNFTTLIQLYAQKIMKDTVGDVPALTFTASYIDSASYLLGAADGKAIGEGYRNSGLDTVGIKFCFYYEGFREANQETSTRIDAEKYSDMVSDYFGEIREREMMKLYGDTKREGEEFLAKNKANSDVVTTASGLQYTVITEGKGPKPTYSDMVKVHYTGTLLDGSVFDSSVQRGEPAVFGVGQVIPGWVEALQLMPVGSKWKLFIPQELAYGSRGAGQIKPYSVLIFEVELLGIEK